MIDFYQVLNAVLRIKRLAHEPELAPSQRLALIVQKCDELLHNGWGDEFPKVPRIGLLTILEAYAEELVAAGDVDGFYAAFGTRDTDLDIKTLTTEQLQDIYNEYIENVQ